MTFETGKVYHDAIGRRWWVLCRDHIKDADVLTVARYFFGGPNKYAHAVIDEDDDGKATVLLDNGFTTIYDDEVKE